MRIAFFGDSLTRGRPGVSFLTVLGAMLPTHELMNCGVPGDTVISLYRRIARDRNPLSSSYSVLWVGVNDALAKVSLGHSVLKRLMRQPPARDLGEFRDHYIRTVELLLERSRHVLAVSPLLIGEDLSSPWNCALGDLSKVVASVAASFSAVDFIDLRDLVTDRLASTQPSKYAPTCVTRIAHDTLCLRTARAVDSASSRRGLQLTLDGLHLNSTGAMVVAEAFRIALRDCCEACQQSAADDLLQTSD